MLAILSREVQNYLKRPLFWLGILIVILGVYSAVSPYLQIHYLTPEEQIVNSYPETIHAGDVFEGYIPSTPEERRAFWEAGIRQNLISGFGMNSAEAEAAVNAAKDLSLSEAFRYFEEKHSMARNAAAYELTKYRKGTNEEINAYLSEVLSQNPFSYYFSRKFADFASLYMGFFATIMLAVLFIQDTRKNTYELLHTKSVSAGSYVAGKALGGFSACLIALGTLNLVFWVLCLLFTRGSGFEVRLFDFIRASCLYILPNMLMIVCIYVLISLLFKNPLPGAPLLILYIVYSNMGGRNADGVYGYHGRLLAVMVRFPGQFFDTAEPPWLLLNQSFLLAASAVMLLLSVRLWKRRWV
ncbi:MAG: ABC transporter permease [Firmicutes bacterium]|nr:ABC transporter permease [Bacillota bacterium]